MIIPGSESFLLRGSERGVLLIHGFTGNPAELRLIGEYLQSRGFTVLCMRLAGHGTDETDLARMTCDDWLYSVLDGLSILRSCCDNISVVGHSMGGLLALKIASMYEIDRLVTLAAPIFIDESLRLDQLPPRDQCVGLTVHKARRRLKNVPPEVYQTYKNMPLISVHELVNVIESVKHNLAAVTAPILILHGKSDHTASFESARFIFDHVGSSVKEIILIDEMGHLLPLDEGREEVFRLTAEFLMR